MDYDYPHQDYQDYQGYQGNPEEDIQKEDKYEGEQERIPSHELAEMRANCPYQLQSILDNWENDYFLSPDVKDDAIELHNYIKDLEQVKKASSTRSTGTGYEEEEVVRVKIADVRFLCEKIINHCVDELHRLEDLEDVLTETREYLVWFFHQI